MQETDQYFEKRFLYEQVLDFYNSLRKILFTHRNYEILSKSLVPNGERRGGIVFCPYFIYEIIVHLVFMFRCSEIRMLRLCVKPFFV